MIKLNNACECIQLLMRDGRVSEYCPPYNTLAPGFDDVPEGQVCLSNDVYEDNGCYDFNDDWEYDINHYVELYPIEYCPLCGKKLEYTRINSLTKKL